MRYPQYEFRVLLKTVSFYFGVFVSLYSRNRNQGPFQRIIYVIYVGVAYSLLNNFSYSTNPDIMCRWLRVFEGCLAKLNGTVLKLYRRCEFNSTKIS